MLRSLPRSPKSFLKGGWMVRGSIPPGASNFKSRLNTFSIDKTIKNDYIDLVNIERI